MSERASRQLAAELLIPVGTHVVVLVVVVVVVVVVIINVWERCELP